MKKSSLEIIESLKSNGCNISATIKKHSITLDDFQNLLEDDSFKSAYQEAEQARDDYARAQLLKLIKSGEKTAIIEYNKQLRQAGDIAEAKMIRKKTMKSLIEMAETKVKVLQEFCNIFKISKSHSDDLYKECIIEYKIKTPYERQKEKRKKIESSLAERFKNNKLTEIEMLKGLLEQALYTAETAEYPSERATASKEAREIGKRMEEIQEREEKKKRLSLFDTSVLMDSTIFGVTPEKIKEIEAQQSWIPKIEVKD